MNTAIACKEANTSSFIDKHFGKCSFFCIVNESTGKVEFIANPGLNVPECKAEIIVKTLIAKKIKKVISGDFGTNVQKLLNHHKIQMILHPDDSIRISELVRLLTIK